MLLIVLALSLFTAGQVEAAIAFRAATQASSTSSSLAINKPTGVVEGDFMLAGITVNRNSVIDPVISPPSGWTLVRSNVDALVRNSTYQKLAGSSEPSSYTWTINEGARMAGGIAAFSGVDSTTPIQVENGAVHSGGGSTSHATPSISTSGSDTWLVSVFGDRTSSTSSTWTAPSGATERADVNTGSTSPNVSVSIHTQGPVTAGSKSHTATASVSSADAGMEIIALNPGGGAPAAPSGLSATAASSSEIDLAWTDNSSDETGFKIERKTGAGGSYGQIDTTGANATTYGDTELDAATEYYYKVRATNASGDSAYSNEDSATTEDETYDGLVNRFAADLVSYWKFEGDGTDEQGTQNATITGSPELNVETIVDLDTIAEGAPADGEVIAWSGGTSEYAQASHNSAHKTAAGTIVVTFQCDTLAEKSVLVAADSNAAAGGLSVEVNTDGSSRAFLRNSSGTPVILAGQAEDVQLNRAYTQIFKWGTGGLSLALYDDADTLVRRVTDTLTDGASGTSTIRFGAWHSDVAHHDGPYGRVIWLDRRISDAEEADLARAKTISGDTTPPTVSITAPDDNDIVKGSISVTATASDDVGVVGVQFKINGDDEIAPEVTTPPYSITWDTTAVTNESHTLSAVARDAAGNLAASSVTITVDNSMPTVSITSPADEATVSGSISVTADAADNHGVVGVQFKLDGNDLGTEDTTSPYSVSWDTTGASNGSHTLTAVARDAAGNSTTSTAIGVIVDNAVGGTGEIAFRAASQASATSSSLAINKPSGVVDGDFMLAGITVNRNSVIDPVISPPSGWTLVRSNVDALVRTSVYQKPASSEPSSYTWTINEGARMAGGIVAFTGVDSTTPIQVENGTVEGGTSTTSHTTPTIETSGSETWLVSIFGDRTGSSSSTWTAPSGATEQADVNTGSSSPNVSVSIHTQGPVTAGSKSHTATASVSSADAGMEIIALNAGAGGGGGSAPAAPSGLGATAVSGSQINLAWTDNSSDETGFKIERKTGAGGTYEQIVLVGAGVTSYSNTGLSNSTTYYYRVRAYNDSGDSAYSDEANATTEGETYDNLVASFAPDVVSYWKFENDGTDEEGTQNATITGSPELNVDTIVDLDSNGECIAWSGGTGQYAQAAHNAAHKTAAGTIVVTFQSDGLAKKSILVAADSNAVAGGLSVEVDTDGSPRSFLRQQSNGAAVILTGNAGDVATNEAYTMIFKWGTGGLSMALWNEDGTLVRRVTNALTDGVTGTSTIRFGAWHNDNVHHDGPYGRVIWLDRRISDTEEATLARAKTIVRGSGPAAPSGLSATAVSSSQINLAWTDNSGDETGFKIERKTGAGGTYSQIDTVGSGVTTYNNTSLSASTTYYYRVRAYNGSGDSAYSNEANATTQSSGALPDLPFFGQYYGGAPAAVFNGNNRMRASDTQGESFFFYAERTATPTHLDWHWRIDNTKSYSKGDGGKYTIEIRKANPTTKRPLTGGSDVICQITGVLPGSSGPAKFPTYEFDTTGQLVAGDPYCVVVRNTHTDPGGNFVSINHSLQTIWNNDATGGSGYTVPGTGGGSGSINVASGGIAADAVGSSAARIAGWTPFILFGKDWTPWPIGTEGGNLRFRRMGGMIGQLYYAGDGITTNWGTTASETSYKANIQGTNQFRDRFRVTRASRTVSGVYIRAARLSGSGGNLLVRLESGPHNDAHTPGNGTLIEQVSVPASLFLDVGSSEIYNQVKSGSDTGALDLVHYVWVPFSQNRTLTLGQTYAIRLVPDGCNLQMWCSARSETSPRWRGMPNGRTVATWSEWESTRECSWNAWEDSRGCQISTDGGSSWSYGPSSARHSPITFKCVQ